MVSLLHVLGVLIPTAVGYATWLGNVTEAPRERRDRIRDYIDEREFSSGEIGFQVECVTFSEKQSYRYKLRKFVPIARKLDGVTIVTLRSDGGEISIRADGFGPTEYLSGTLKTNDRLGNGHPDFECEQGFRESDKVKLHIESWSGSKILELLEDVPLHLHETLNNYPGSSEYDFNK
ncbi:hypothetical protein NP511_18420 [Natrinema thermotolerans]|uniref:Uncharacterized protein n=1 Tax=Natrinema thermotolerans TaxID=121872 RepID=A0AAF0PB92_9EURY|nr:hypothetical protein [Natrinema thermotolerans]WMT07349.1 hypothetical protein NP511_18420 [Natrinema thermotolerans]